MTENKLKKMAAAPSRRSFMAALAWLPWSDSTTPARDAELIDLGYQFALLADQVDLAIEKKLDVSWEVLSQLDSTHHKILNIEARSTVGLFVKAQTICWGKLGDLDPCDD